MRIDKKPLLWVGLLVLLGSATPGLALTLPYSATFEPEVLGATGSGSALITFDTDLNTMRVEANFAGLSGTSTVAHIHCCTASPGTGTVGVATITPSFTGWPVGVTAGAYDLTYDTSLASTYNAAFVTANGGTAASALAALLAGIDAGTAYFNVHSTTFPGGEIRGFLAPVPEPGTGLLLLVGIWLAARASRPR
jgi:hypothetical protein